MFTESKTIKQITILPAQSAVNVQWVNTVFKDGAVIAESFERKAYSAAQKAEFLAEVEGAGSFIESLGW